MHYKISAFELLGNHNAISLLVREFQMQIVDFLHYLFPIIAPLVGRGGFYVLNAAHKGIKINRERDCAIAYKADVDADKVAIGARWLIQRSGKTFALS